MPFPKVPRRRHAAPVFGPVLVPGGCVFSARIGGKSSTALTRCEASFRLQPPAPLRYISTWARSPILRSAHGLAER